jgi:hypothetical protein
MSPRDPQGAETRRLKFEKVYPMLGESTQYVVTIQLAFGWQFEASATTYRRWRLAVIGGGLHLGEPWAYDGPLWSLNLRVYAFGVMMGFRGPAPEVPPISPDEWDTNENEPEPRIPCAGEEQ